MTELAERHDENVSYVFLSIFITMEHNTTYMAINNLLGKTDLYMKTPLPLVQLVSVTKSSLDGPTFYSSTCVTHLSLSRWLPKQTVTRWANRNCTPGLWTWAEVTNLSGNRSHRPLRVLGQ